MNARKWLKGLAIACGVMFAGVLHANLSTVPDETYKA
ncbi:hydroxylamine dehydrogenase, partial [Nitrosomonas sp. Nm33]